YSFTNYFHCRHCGSSGPWDVVDLLKVAGLALRSLVDKNYDGFYHSRCALFDGTFIQTPAMGEDYLLNLVQKDPRNAFLHTRLGNLLRGCNQESKAAEWYQKALSLDPGDIEARYHLFSFAVEADDIPSVLVHAPLLVRYLLEGRTTGNEELTEGLALSVV